MLNNKLRAEEASEYAGSFIQIEDHWTEEVLKSLALTDLGREVEVLPRAINSLPRTARGKSTAGVPGLQEQAHHDEVQTRG